MRKKLCCLCLAVLLCGCGSRGEEKFAQWQQSVSGEEFSFTAHVTASTGEALWTYAAAVDSRPGETEATLTEPAALAGLTLRQKEEGAL